MLTLEFLADGSPDCPLLLLHGKSPAVARSLAGALAAMTSEGLELHAFPGVEAVAGCRVSAHLARRDQGIRQLGPTEFAWELTFDGWGQVAALMEPFTAMSPTDGFQWLQTGNISFIVSTTRRW